MVGETITGSVFYSHVMPAIIGFIGIILICDGMMDEKRLQVLLGVLLFFAAGFLPFLILGFVLGV